MYSTMRHQQLDELSCHLRRAKTATGALTDWCEARSIGTGPVRAIVQEPGGKPRPDDEALDALQLAPAEPMAHRRVVLTRGNIALSDCDLWWLPERLPEPLLDALSWSDMPFGTVVSSLRPRRRTLYEARLPADGPHVLEHRAVVLTGEGLPIAAVRERYRASLLN